MTALSELAVDRFEAERFMTILLRFYSNGAASDDSTRRHLFFDH
jgi:hypothetical protein